MDVRSMGLGGPGVLVGIVNEKVQWDIEGYSPSANNRRVGVLLNNIPTGSKQNPEPNNKELFARVGLDWTPDKKQRSGKDLEVHLRDIDYCVHFMKSQRESPDKCFQNRPISATDTVVPLKWEVATRQELNNLVTPPGGTSSGSTTGNQNVIAVSDASACATTPTSNSDLQGKILQTGIQVLTNPGGAGALFPSLLQGLLGGAGSGSGGGALPQECIKP